MGEQMNVEVVEKVDILAIGAHAGDVEISMGMILAHHVNQGKRVAVLHLTPGEKGHPSLSPDVYAEMKRQEAREAAAVLDAPVYFLPYKDGELPVNDEVKFKIADVIRDCRPDTIITHWKNSIHKDHSNCHLNVPDAVFYAAIKAFEREKPAHFARSLFFAENWEDSEGYVPEVYVELHEGDIDLWQRMVEKYALFRGEVVKFPYVEYYRSLAHVRGIEMYCQNASTLAIPSGARKKRVQTL
jgi:LmbE family N-acetylglucosaminyl deacetylase